MNALESPRIMLDRASEQVTELYAKVWEFTTLHKYEVVREHNAELGLDVLKMKIVGAPPLPNKFALLVGEFANSLRGALDHLVWAFITGTPKGHKRIEFPIFDIPGQFKAERKKKIGLLPSAAQDEIERLQPYHAGDQSHSHPLWRVHRLAVSHKHRHIVIIAHSFRYSMSGGKNVRFGLTMSFRSGLDTDPIAPIPPIPEAFAKQVDFKVEPLFSIELQNADIDTGIFMPLGELETLHQYVRDKVFAALEPLVP
jgi:hypothetical protein